MTESTEQTPSSSPANTGRRRFLGWVTYATGAVAAVLLAIPFTGYLFGALRKHRALWVPLGPTTKFPPNETRLETFENPLGEPWDGMTAHMGVYVRNLGEESVSGVRHELRHLGCPVTWFPQSGLFMCPCHGGVYYENGERASGPPTRGLFHCQSGKCATDNWKSRRRTCRPCSIPWTNRRKREDRR